MLTLMELKVVFYTLKMNGYPLANTRVFFVFSNINFLFKNSPVE